MASIYKQSVPVFIRYLKNLSAILQKGVEYADQQKMKHEYMLNFRLVHDMQGITYQVQSCCNTAKFLVARLGAGEDVYFEDNETTFDQLQTRIAKTIELLEEVDAHSMDGLKDEPVLMKTKSMGTFRFETAQSYIADYAIPNFHFHLGTAYAILRHLSVPLNAFDFFGKGVFVKVDE